MTLVTVTPHLKMPRTGFHCMTWLSLAVPELSTTCGSNLRRDRGIVSLLTTRYHHTSSMSYNLGRGCTLPAEPFTAAMYQRVSTFSFQCQVRVGVLGKTLEPRQLGKVVTAAAEDTDTALDTENTGCRCCSLQVAHVVDLDKI